MCGALDGIQRLDQAATANVARKLILHGD